MGPVNGCMARLSSTGQICRVTLQLGGVNRAAELRPGERLGPVTPRQNYAQGWTTPRAGREHAWRIKWLASNPGLDSVAAAGANVPDWRGTFS